MEAIDKVTRVLTLYSKLMSGKLVNKRTFIEEYGISSRSFDRDIEDIRIFFSETFSGMDLVYDRERQGYYIENLNIVKELSPMETVVLITMLKETRALRKDEFLGLMSSLLEATEKRNQQKIKDLVKETCEDYNPVNHDRALLKLFWDLEQCILKRNIIILKYKKRNGEEVERMIYPLDIEFSEYYFYLIGLRADCQYKYPAFFRFDRIESFQLTLRTFDSLVIENYKKMDLKKHLKYMQAGERRDVLLWCEKGAFENLLDTFEKYEVIESQEDGAVVKINIFQDGFIQWVLGQGENILVLEPKSLQEEIKIKLKSLLEKYEEL